MEFLAADPVVSAKLVLGPRITIEYRFSAKGEHIDTVHAVDTSAEFAPADITEMTLTLDVTPHVLHVIAFSELVVFLNGMECFRGRRDQAEIDEKTTRFALAR